jgi:dynein heavy chain, axonemal
MYQYSLGWFINLFLLSIAESAKSDDLLVRLENLKSHFTYSLYGNVCRSLFKKDKLLFSLILCVGILKGAALIDQDEWLFLLTGGLIVDPKMPPNPAAKWLSDKAWGESLRISSLQSFASFALEIEEKRDEWEVVYNSAEPYKEPLPGEWDQKLNNFQKLLIMRIVRPDKLVPAVMEFVRSIMGQKFVEVIQNLNNSLHYLTCQPVIPILTVWLL